MNAGIITKIEYRLDGGSTYTEFTFTFFTASFVSETKKTAAGLSYHLKVDLKIAKTGKTNSDTLQALVGRKLNIRFTDGNERVHTAGSTNYPARLTYTASIQGEAGGWNGYDVTITHDSPIPYTIADS